MYHVLYYSIVLLLSVFVVVLTHQLYFVIDLLSLLIGPNNIVIIHGDRVAQWQMYSYNRQIISTLPSLTNGYAGNAVSNNYV